MHPGLLTAHRTTKAEVHSLNPYQRLMWAVVLDAHRTLLNSALGRNAWERQRRDEAWEWFNNAETNWPFSFANCCHVVQLDPGYVLRLVKRDYAEVVEARMARKQTRHPAVVDGGMKITASDYKPKHLRTQREDIALARRKEKPWTYPKPLH